MRIKLKIICFEHINFEFRGSRWNALHLVHFSSQSQHMHVVKMHTMSHYRGRLRKNRAEVEFNRSAQTESQESTCCAAIRANPIYKCPSHMRFPLSPAARTLHSRGPSCALSGQSSEARLAGVEPRTYLMFGHTWPARPNARSGCWCRCCWCSVYALGKIEYFFSSLLHRCRPHLRTRRPPREVGAAGG